MNINTRPTRAQEILEGMILEWDYAEPDLRKFGEYVNRVLQYARYAEGRDKKKEDLGAFCRDLTQIIADASRLLALCDTPDLDISEHLQTCDRCGFLVCLYKNQTCKICYMTWDEGNFK